VCVIQNIRNVVCTLITEFENSAFTAIKFFLSEGWILICATNYCVMDFLVYKSEIIVFGL
jgi:hypothetical protein